MASLTQDFQAELVLHFPTPVKFTRWLFEQERGSIAPSCVLVTGAREAKPCAEALLAAQTDDVSHLRKDARRPPLKDVLGNRASGDKKIAVASMLVMAGTEKQM